MIGLLIVTGLSLVFLIMLDKLQKSKEVVRNLRRERRLLVLEAENKELEQFLSKRGLK